MKSFQNKQIQADLLNIWTAGSAGADAKKLVQNAVSVDESVLQLGQFSIDLDTFDRIRVVGAGKAADAMASGLESALGPAVMCDKEIQGWINIPDLGQTDDRKPDVLRKTVLSRGSKIWRFPARPLTENLPTQTSYAGTLLMGDIVRRTSEREICICLLSGGGSALMTQPIGRIKIDDKRALISFLNGRGTSIRELNTVRKQISAVKGGRLAAEFKGLHLVTLMISDVLGDEMGLIASGPTVQDSSTPEQAIEILKAKDPGLKNIPNPILNHLQRFDLEPVVVPGNVTNQIVGNLDSALDASVRCADLIGYQSQSEVQAKEFETADECGRRLANWIIENAGQTKAFVSGGEPVVNLCDEPGRGGRNLQLALAALDELLSSDVEKLGPFALISGGTDGQDGNTSAAGAWLTSESVCKAQQESLDPGPYLRKNDAYSFFEKHEFFDLLIAKKQNDSNVDGRNRTAQSMSQTNVGDLRICLTGSILDK